MQHNIAFILLATLTLGANVANAGPPKLLRLSYYQTAGIPDPEEDYCIVSEDVKNGSKIKLKKCDDPYQDDTKLWIVSGKKWKSYIDPSLCVEVANVKKTQKLRLKRCTGKSKQKWYFDIYRGEDGIRPFSNKKLCVAYSSDFVAEAGDDIYLDECKSKQISWRAKEVDGDDDDDNDDDDVEDEGNCDLYRFRVKGTNLCAGRVGDYEEGDGEVQLMKCSSKLTKFCWYERSGRIQAEVGIDTYDHTYWETGGDEEIVLQNPVDGHRGQKYVLKKDGVLKAKMGQCVTYEGSSSPDSGDKVVVKDCDDVDTKWLAESIGSGDDDDDDDDDDEYKLCKFKLKGTRLCAGDIDGELELVKCSKDSTTMRWYKNGRIQPKIGGDDNYWESCSGSCCNPPPKYCKLQLQNPVDNGEQKYTFYGGNLVLKANKDACVTYDGRYPNKGDSITLVDCDDLENDQWKAKCN